MAPEHDELLGLLAPDLVERLQALGVDPAHVNRYGDDRVRWVVERYEAEHARQPIPSAVHWVIGTLRETWQEPPSMLQLGLPFAVSAAEAARPPASTRWARDTVTGRIREVVAMDAYSVKFDDGTRLPAYMWPDGWEWLDALPEDRTP